MGKINVGYATSAKLVNVKKLKTDLWSTIEHSPQYTTQTEVFESEKENNVTVVDRAKKSVDMEAAMAKKDTLSFQNVVKEVATCPSTKQKDASLSFYFISLLHLANEKVCYFFD